jgi:hypothetical protein
MVRFRYSALMACAMVVAGLATSQAAGSPGWVIQRLPRTEVHEAGLTAVSCTSATECTAVGTSAAGSLAEQWDGSRLAMHALRPGSVVHAVSCTSPTACTAVGYGAGVPSPLIERWNGRRWVIQASPPEVAAGLNAVSCASGTSCTAVGLDAIEQWNGTSWTAAKLPSVGGNFFDVSCTSPTACMAVGPAPAYNAPPLVERWDGSTWTVQYPPSSGGSLTSVSCSSSSACTAVGSSGSGNGMLLEAWNGTQWRVQPTPNLDRGYGAFLSSVSCTSASACLAVGSSNQFGAGVARTLVLRWDGTEWSVLPTPVFAGPQDEVLTGVSCLSAMACIAVGYLAGPTELPLEEAWNGARWVVHATVSPPDPVLIPRLTDVSCSSAAACIAVGGYTSVLTVTERWNGRRWSPVRAPNQGNQNNSLAGVSCSARSACMAVGAISGIEPNIDLDGAVAARWNGRRWSRAANAGERNEGALLGVSCGSATACVAVGYSGFSGHAVAERWNGRRWSLVRTPPAAGPHRLSRLKAVSCASRTACTAVGYAANRLLVERWDGVRWSLERAPAPAGARFSALNGVACPSLSSCVAVGYINRRQGSRARAIVERWDGVRWSLEPTPNLRGAAASKLEAVACAESTTCVAVGYSADEARSRVTLAERWDGSRWTVEHTPNLHRARNSELDAISCPPTACVAVGYSGNAMLAERITDR